MLNLVGAVTAFAILPHIADKVNWTGNKTIKMLSSLYMPMYLFHQQIIYFTISVFNGKIPPGVLALVNFISALFGSFLISISIIKK